VDADQAVRLLRQHELAEADHRTLNPFTDQQLMQLGDVSRIGAATRILDLASQLWTVHEWLRANPGHPEATAMREYADSSRRSYLAYNRRYLGWGVFVLRPAPA